MQRGMNRQEATRSAKPFVVAALTLALAACGLVGPTTGTVTQQQGGSHHGIDIGNTEGTEIAAACKGTVIAAGDVGDGYGNQIIVAHDKQYLTRYAHLSAMLVKFGDTVTKGQVIGKMGSTGNARGSHLHFELRRGAPSEGNINAVPSIDLNPYFPSGKSVNVGEALDVPDPPECD